MLTQEIRSANWEDLCDSFNTLHRGALITVETVDAEGHHETVAEKVRLDDMRFDAGGPCSSEIVITMENERGQSSAHTIIEPIYVRIQQDPRGSKILKIDAENGGTWVHFPSGRIQELLRKTAK